MMRVGISILSACMLSVLLLSYLPLRCESRGVRTYKPVYVPYIFQLLGDRGWKKEDKTLSGRTSMSKITADKSRRRHKSRRKKEKKEKLEIRLTGTENIQITEDDAKSKDVSPNRQSPGTCRLPSAQGTCRDFSVRWFYNSDPNNTRCEMFWYGGCDGNANNFESEEKCKSACVIEEDVCKQPSVTGRCRARHVRWYYNADRRECLQFVYGGCGGNGNRFRTRTECERQCQAGTSALGDEQKSCRRSRYGCCPDGVNTALGNNNEGCPNACESTRYGCCDDDVTAAEGPNQEGCEMIEISSGVGVPCDQTDFGCCPDGITAAQGASNEGCVGVETRTLAPVTPDRRDPDIVVDVPAQCKLASDTGSCRDDLKVMWYYNITARRCQRFWYGGCGGNANRYKSEKECLTTCQHIIKEPEKPTVPVCEQPKEIGPCRALIPRWFYNKDTSACEEFSYGGCQGNNNNFESRDQCERYCRVRRGTPVAKPGRCPSDLPTNDSCVSTCRYDGDCASSDKCCRDARGCSRCYPAQTDVERVLTRDEVCALSPEPGPCKASVVKYYYNPSSRQCKRFRYGGCQGNRNSFDTLQACQQYCGAEPVDPGRRTRQPVCEMTPAMGPCDRRVTKYFFNITAMECQTFVYGGCLGNHNNFETESKCMSYCSLRPSAGMKENCLADPVRGSCRGNFRRWSYDGYTGQCSTFTYGGCQGNGNNFESEDVCLSSCSAFRIESVTRRPATRRPVTTERPNTPAPRNEDVCSLPLVTPCEDNSVGINWYYDKLNGVCREVPNGECNNNRNNFQSREQCENYCSRMRVCRPLTYSSDIRCLASMERYTYNYETGACERFMYGGCGGSANNFETLQACQRKCEGRTPPATEQPASQYEVCAMAEDSGNCLAYNRNWRYDHTMGRCVEFVYGGCGGNKNNFETREKCESFCSRDVVCRQYEEPEVSCLAYMRRWRYDPSTRQCENFVFGGCDGNSNNFETFEACEQKCVPKRDTTPTRVSTWSDICRQNADRGPCTQYVQKWRYNVNTMDCEEFTYGGCLGNHNNFESREQCMTYCDSSRFNRPDPRPDPTDEPEIESSGEMPTTETPTGVAVCHLDSETGPCKAYIRAWYYNSDKGECQQFGYGGCGGNGNRFNSQEECERRCSAREVCLLPQQSGSCMAYLKRYSFDYSAQTCREFVYGGCEGNANNFGTSEACMKRCDSLIRDKEPVGPKRGYCPPRTDWQGLLGACAPQCQEDNDCTGSEKCCHHGCGLRCISPVAEEPYQMDAPVRLRVNTLSENTIFVNWNDPGLGRDQRIRDGRFYTIRYHTFSEGQYHYYNATDLSMQVNGLNEATDYHFRVRVNNPPYLSEWSEESTNRTAAARLQVKSGLCPVNRNDSVGICLEECRSDGDCAGVQKCCENGCGHTCTYPTGFDICSLKEDAGRCSKWTVRWFYNRTSARCERFWYGGCNDGNANNFMDENTCKARCVGLPPVTPSVLPYNCRRSMFGCCADRYTPAVDAKGSNCPENNNITETVVPVNPGEKATLDCRYRDVTWYREGKLVTSNVGVRVEDDGKLTILAATIEDDGVYACHVGIDTRRPRIYRFTLQVRVPIGILPGPNRITVKPNHMAFLHCEVYGNPTPRVSWRRGSMEIQSGGHYSTFSNGTLLIRKATESDIADYTCAANNGVSQPVYRTIALTLREMLVARIENNNGRVTEGSRFTLSCEGRGYPTPTITWEKMGRPIRTGGNVYISTDGRLVVRDASLDDTGSYTCIVANSEEKIETSTSVQVVPKDIPDESCEDKTGLMKCRLIVMARLCFYDMYEGICCSSCKQYFNSQTTN